MSVPSLEDFFRFEPEGLLASAEASVKPGYAIAVEFRLKPGTLAAFRALIDANARDSCRNESGCRRFDVLEPKGETDRILLYEIYDDLAAFGEHLKAPHFAVFDKASAPLVLEKRVVEYAVVCEGSAA